MLRVSNFIIFCFNRGYLWLGVFLSIITAGIAFVSLAKFHRRFGYDITQSIIYSKGKHKSRPKILYKKTKKNLMGLYQFENPINSYLYTYSMILQVSLPKLPQGWALRIFTGWWWIYCILLAVAYRASMTSILANPSPR